MLSATALLFIAAQAGFLDGPRVLANMALDRWFPTRFATLSDRFVAQNGVLLMGGAALVVVLATRGAVGLLVVLYSINVFITFSLSQLAIAVAKKFPQAVFFGGQLVFIKESRLGRLLHNFTVFALQRDLFRHGIPFLIVPIHV